MSDEEFSSDSGNDKIALTARKVVRFLLSNAEASNGIVTKSRLQVVVRTVSEQLNNDRKIPMRVIIEHVNGILWDVYGFRLLGIPPRGESSTAQPALADPSKADHFLLVNKLPWRKHFDEFKLSQVSSTYDKLIVDGEYVGGEMSLSDATAAGTKLGVDEDLVCKGLTAVALSIILFSRNNIVQRELLHHLSEFGIPIDGTRIPILEWSIDEFLRWLERREYVVRAQDKTDLEGSSTLYRTGRRTQTEFPLPSLVQLVRETMALTPEQAATLEDDIRQSVADAYGPVPTEQD
ncbi:Smc5-Smc6 complex subunit NSE3 KNAG_0F03350 [Huiozyma naganishii CBS 8797]|uniref:MAGE domain-containing protein n=1 Tax=Huiozyma naganishii (strain ATCC MYA-139 / BCRC 22969 / CBS 8797 / KCTC 17520 / NBRC 10181 / NCYC 3082 / Yp74L-3) TaxID=1071383 RepID=J7S0I1_HUIN7|nr:hypothetical protein KNAG_0F03350 [Kazachstania naganishii CBS 8797]CCK70997.1 hypothetical protein KNAG_0F03350 [Kazachstania naganishii CBS 8797]